MNSSCKPRLLFCNPDWMHVFSCCLTCLCSMFPASLRFLWLLRSCSSCRQTGVLRHVSPDGSCSSSPAALAASLLHSELQVRVPAGRQDRPLLHPQSVSQGGADRGLYPLPLQRHFLWGRQEVWLQVKFASIISGCSSICSYCFCPCLSFRVCKKH